jgi:outer membrane protein
MREFVGALIVVLAVASEASSQPVGVRAVAFDEAIRLALDRNPTVAQAATSIARADAILQQARAITLPNVSAQVSSTTLDTAQGFEAGITRPRNQVTFAGTVTMPVLAPARWAARARARADIEVATLSTTEVRQQVAVATAQAYLAVIRAQRQIEVEERALENARAHLDYAQRRLEGGLGSRLNMLRASQEAMVGEARLENAELALRQSWEALGVLLAEDGPVDAAGEPAFAVPASIDEATWTRRRPDLLAQNAIVRSAERVVRDSWKDVAPSAEASFDPQYVTPAGLFQPSRTWRFTVSVTQPLYLGGLQRAVTREREIVVDASRFALTELEIQARSEVRLARASVSSFDRSLASVRAAEERAAEVLSITTTSFEVGATTNIEVIDAQRSARDAGTAVALAEDAVQRARLDLLVALGEFPQ